jgi:hypothetical protein
MSLFPIIALVLIFARAIAELWLSGLNERHVRAHANEVPPAFRGTIDDATYRRSVDYTLAKSRFGDVVTVFDTALLIGILGSVRHVRFCNGRFSFRHRPCIKHCQFAIRLVRAVQTGRSIRFQHDYGEDLGA